MARSASQSAAVPDDAALEARAGGYERWRAVDLDGEEVVIERWPGQPERAATAAAAADWLHPRGFAARPRRRAGDLLFSVPPAGAGAGEAHHLLDAPATLVALGRALRDLHALEPGREPVRRTLDDVVGLAEARVRAGLVDADDLRVPYRRFGPERLLALARAGLEATGPDETRVVSHGACSIDHLYLDGGRATAWLRLDAVAVADRHVDLARLAKEVAERMGPEAVPILFDAYGTPPDAPRLDALALLDELLP